MSFETESFEDLSSLTYEKLVKLRDRAAQNAMEAANRADADRQRWIDITQEMERRK